MKRAEESREHYPLLGEGFVAPESDGNERTSLVTWESRAFWPLFLISLLGHGLVLYLLKATEPASIEPVPVQDVPAIRLRLVVRQQPVQETAALPETEPLVEEPSPPLPGPDEPVSPAPALVETLNDSQLAEREEPAPEPTPAQPARTPTTLGIRQSVQDIVDQQGADNYRFDCNPLQKENDLIECGSEDTRDYRILERNIVTDYFTARLAGSRPEPGIGVMALQSEESRARADTLPPDTAGLDIFLQSLSISVDGLATAADKRKQDLEDEMYANDRTYQIKKRVMRGR